MDAPFPTALSTAPWSATKKGLFRACFLFFVLYVFFNPNDVIPITTPLYDFYSQPFHIFIPWAGKHILHLSYAITAFTGGSGDTTYDYVILLLIAVLTILGSLIWTAIDRRRDNYTVLYYWLTVLIRYYCAYNMFSYGIAKLYKLQFPFPSPGGLLQPFGSFSPMHVAWAFLGYSKGYNYFMGLAEVISGLLLLFRRTTRLGALLLLVVSANIVAVNYCFDVCVKLLSTALFVMAVFLLLQERRRLIDFFFRNRVAAPESEWAPRFRKRGVNVSLLVLKYLVTIAVVVNINTRIFEFWDGYRDDRAKPNLYGIFNVDTFVKNGDTLAPVLTDSTRWRRLVMNYQGGVSYVSVRQMNDSAKTYVLRSDSTTKQVTLFREADSTKKFYFSYSLVGRDSLYLKGRWKGDSVSVFLKRYDLDNFILVSRGFHFINEGPFQR